MSDPSRFNGHVTHEAGGALMKPWLALDKFEGPLDLLYDLARAQKVSLADVSILDLVEQYLKFVAQAHAIRMELAADWLVMAAWLTWLKSKLLLPQEADLQDTEEASATLHARLAELQSVRNAAAWLGAQPTLDERVFARGASENLTRVDRSGVEVDLTTLIAAYLRLSRRRHRKVSYTPQVTRYWTVYDATQALQRMLHISGDRAWHGLEDILDKAMAVSPFEYRAAFAGALSACLEMAKSGALHLEQHALFSPVRFAAAPSKRSNS